MSPDIWQRHADACRQKQTFYLDPDSGYQVFTEYGLSLLGKCCGSGCRHCPYAHENVPEDRRPAVTQQASWLTPFSGRDAPVDVLFWSGGKDSFLALRALQRDLKKNLVVLVTTFDAQQRRVAHQELELDAIVRQAQHLDLPLLGIPLHSGLDYQDAVEPALRQIPHPARLVFGDLHLRHIRTWREQAFRSIAKELGAALAFPLWQADYESLLQDLEQSGVVCEVSAVTTTALGHVQLGERFNRDLVERLPDDVDAFGENGEFHTLARVWEHR